MIPMMRCFNFKVFAIIIVLAMMVMIAFIARAEYDPKINGLDYHTYQVEVPSSPSDSCRAGTWAADADYVYTCYPDDTWERSARDTWVAAEYYLKIDGTYYLKIDSTYYLRIQ